MAYPNVIAQLVSGLVGKKLRPQPETAERVLIRETLSLLKLTADGAAGNATAYTASHQIRMPRACKVLGVYVHPQAALTGDNSNNATVKVVKGDGAAGAETVIASQQTTVANGNWVAGTTKTLTLSSTVADLRIAAGGVLSFSIAKTGTGVVVPICAFTVDVEWEDQDSYTTTT